MKTENKFLLDKIIKNKCSELGFESMEIQKEGPVIITDETMKEFIRFCNEANRELCGGIAWGRFWCDEENYDFAYEVILPEKVIEKDTEEATRQLFDIPCTHYQDLHTPHIMLASKKWKSDMAIRYLQELRENGYVDNADYGLW